MRAGQLRHRVTIQRSALAAANSYGAQAETWSDVATVCAEVLSLYGSEAWKAKQIQPEATTQVRIRYTGTITTADRLKYGTRYLYPLSIVNDEKGIETRMLCGEKL